MALPIVWAERSSVMPAVSFSTDSRSGPVSVNATDALRATCTSSGGMTDSVSTRPYCPITAFCAAAAA